MARSERPTEVSEPAAVSESAPIVGVIGCGVTGSRVVAHLVHRDAEGRLAVVGLSARVDSARIDSKPPMPIGVMAASAPPAMQASISP